VHCIDTIEIREQGPTAAGFEAVLQLDGVLYPIIIILKLLPLLWWGGKQIWGGDVLFKIAINR
jgi:hypothetical protein